MTGTYPCESLKELLCYECGLLASPSNIVLGEVAGNYKHTSLPHRGNDCDGEKF